MMTRCAFVATATAVAALAAGCPPPQPPPPPGETDRRAVIANVVDAIVLPELNDFQTRVANLRQAADAHAASGVDTDRETAQQAWRDAMAAWQTLEMLHLGPAGSPASFVGGEGLRDRIYAWPLVNFCAVDQQILVNEFGEDGWAETRLPNVIGLTALEYVLFVEAAENECPTDAPLNSGGEWAALGAVEIEDRRARYAAVLAADMVVQTASLHGAWTDGGAFAETLKSAGESGSLFPTAQDALDQVYAALFAVELMTKDKKLGIPAGLHVDCTTVTCPEKAESRFSRTSKENIGKNLEATRRVFLGIDAAGADTAGFDDLLGNRGAADLATSMAQSLDAAIAATQGFDGTLEDALASDPARAQALYETVKVFTDDFKSTFPSALGLRVPAEGAGDND